MLKKLIAAMTVSSLLFATPVFASPVLDITSDETDITEEVDIIESVTEEKSENVVALEQTSKKLAKREDAVKELVMEKINMEYNNDVNPDDVVLYYSCYNNKTDYIITEYDGRLFVYYVRINADGTYFLSKIKYTDESEAKFRAMMTSENSLTNDTFWNKVALYNPDFQASGTFNLGNGTVIIPDITLDNLIYTYEKWDRNWTGGTRQKRLHDEYMAFDPEGFGVIRDRYVIACTTTFGNVGDFVDFYMSNGMVFKTVIGDIKSQHDAGCTKWGHKNGKNVIEFIVNSTIWYNTGHRNPGNPGCHPEWAGLSLVKAVNYGSIWTTNLA